ncbi:TonB-dependent receptor plug domain-containing protein [Aquimarina sp. SS2-1]|uniref:TonB-dependent receptor n=1 Tax=Aquimarina besae TaxID=3342247 RepID=UPI0036722B13
MTSFKKLVFFLFFCHYIAFSQEVKLTNTDKNQSLSEVLEAFKSQRQLNFSYDVEAIKNIVLHLQNVELSISSLQEIIEFQTPFLLQKISDTDYIIVKNTKVVNICGVVIDADSKFELPQADILLHKKTIGLTDKNGEFELQLLPSDSISISYFGYRNRTVKISELSHNRCDTIRLQPEIQNLGQVLVKEYLTGGIQKNQDASVNISTKKLRILPGLAEPDVLQSLQLLPGISSPTEDPAGLYIRGGTPGQNLVLWDGIKMYQNGHFFNQISSFNPFITKNVRVYRGGTSVRYGDRISGVVVIESDDDLTEEIQVGGGLNLTHADAYVKLPLSRKLGIMLAGRRSTTDIYQNITYNNLVRKVFQNTRATIPPAGSEVTPEEASREDDISFSDVNFKAIWHLDSNSTIKFSSILAENRLDNKKNIIVEDNLNETQDILKIRNLGASVHWDKTSTNSIFQNANVYYSSYDQRYALGINRPDENLTRVTNTENVVKDVGLEYSIRFPIAKNHSLHTGYQFSYNETDFKFSFDLGLGDDDPVILDANGTNHTLYSEYQYKTTKTYLNLGFRASQLSNVKDFFIEPRIFASYELFKNFTVNTSAELKNQQLNNYSTYGSTEDGVLSTLPVADNVWILSNNSSSDIDDSPSIRVLKSMQFTVGALYSYNGWNFDLEGYYKKITDLSSLSDLILDIATQDDESIVDIFYGEEERIGIDFLIKKRFQNYRIWAGYSLSKTITSFPTVQDSYFVGNFDQRHVFNLSQTLKIKNFEIALGWNYATGRPFTRIIEDSDALFGGTIDPRGINSSRFKDYHRLDVSGVYRFKVDSKKDWNGMIGISIRNLYDRTNTIGQGYLELTDNDFNTTLKTFNNASLPFTPDLVLRFNF